MDTNRKFRILIAEDEFLIALMLTDAIEDLGYEVIGPASRLSAARELVSSTVVDGALLDINLRGEKVYPVVDLLLARDVPVVLCTGYDSAGAIPARYGALPIVGKPFDADELKAVVSRTMLSRAAGVPPRASGASPIEAAVGERPTDLI